MKTRSLRLGLLFGGADHSISEMVKIGRGAELAGVDALYCIEAYRNGLLPLAALAAATEHVTVGPYVLNAYFRTPFAAGLGALDLDEISGGRFELAVGSGNAHITQNWLGVEPRPPLEKMRDYVAVLRLMMRAHRGERVSYRGPVHSIDWMQQAPGPSEKPVPVYLAAIFPKILKSAVDIADGLALGAMCSPVYIRDVIRPLLQSAAHNAGKSLEGFGVKVCVMLAVHEDAAIARELASKAVAGTFAAHPHPYYEHMLREQGFGRQLETCLTAVAAGDMNAAAASLDDDVLDAVVVWGTARQCAERLTAFEGLVDEVVLANVSSSAEYDADPLASYRPLFDVIERVRRRQASESPTRE
jgi:5,10-methylenetetrahydromethanopterin reductase